MTRGSRPSTYRRPVEQLTREALIKSHGNLLAAAQRLGCSRQNVTQTIDRYPALQQLCRDLLEEEVDLHEATLRKLALDKEQVVPTLAFLNNKARHRGWGRPTDDVPAGSLHIHAHLHVEGGAPERLRKMADGDLDQMIEVKRQLLIEAPEPARIINRLRDDD